jgi:hypothetical protein
MGSDCWSPNLRAMNEIFLISTYVKSPNFSAVQRFALVMLRILIGWHFLYEGVIKAYNP